MKAFLFLLISLSATLIGHEPPRDYFVVWNVGQGEWTTWIRQDECWHFDMGGEKLPFTGAAKECGQKLNRVFLSHWDLDHIGGLKKAPRFFPRLCLARGPLGESTARKQALMPKELCSTLPDKIWEWFPSEISAKGKTNERSRIFGTSQFLVTGDSPQKEEEVWSADPLMPLAAVLVLGHHGSRTSTSDALLHRLTRLKQAVCTAKWSRYHHPHAETVVRLRRARVPMLRTEDWGSLWFEL